MARLAQRSTGALAVGRAPSPMDLVAGVPLALWLAVGSSVLSYAGAVWDVSWHRTVGRDTFWSPPHLVLYAGVLAGLGVAVWPLAESALRPRRFPGPSWRVGALSLSAGFLLATIGRLVTLLSAPFDDLWHLLYGRDVDIWSPPHLTGLLGNAIALTGWTMALMPWLAGSKARSPGGTPSAVFAFFLGNLLYTGWFSLNWYHMVSASRDALLYPSLVGLALLPFLTAAGHASQTRWGATAAAAAFVGFAIVPIAALDVVGWRAPAFPPLLVVPALGLDLLRRASPRLPGSAATVAEGVAFALLFVAVEFLRMAVAPPPLPPGGLAARVVGPYLVAAAERPWTLPSVATALPTVLLASVVGATVGRLVAALLRRGATP
ncbi:MAG TPA: hypothetical protein VIN09_04805 [Chloroflexota bacterium]